jgi:hypothetical protein
MVMEVREVEEEHVRGLLNGLQLSEAERRGVRGAWLKADKGEEEEAHVVGKLFAEKPGHAEGIAQTLGRIWCPNKGIRCRELGCNLFALTYLQR